MTIHQELLKLGFKINNLTINGFIPHYIKDNNVLFIIGHSYFIQKIVKISEAYKHKGITVYGVMGKNAPIMAEYDWAATVNDLKLIKVNPLEIAVWNKDRSDLEYIPHFI